MPDHFSAHSFQRVLSTLSHQEPDRVPNAEIWVDPEVKQSFLGRPIVTIADEVDFWVCAGYDFIALDTDLYATPAIQNSIVQPHENTADHYSEHRQNRNWISSNSHAISSWADVERFPWPTADSLDYFVYDLVKKYLPPDMKAIVTFGHIFTAAWQLMGFEAFCITLREDKSLVREILNKLGQETMLLLKKVLTYDIVGAMCFQDDIAYKNGLMISPALLRELFLPWLEQAAEICHASGRPFLFHSDGMLNKVLPDIVAAGVDALHPVEPKCMDIAAVKQEYRGRLALIGNVDLGYTLTRGTPQEVQEAVLDLIEDIAPGGGFMLGSANSITNYVPLDNYKAMLHANQKYGGYPIKLPSS